MAVEINPKKSCVSLGKKSVKPQNRQKKFPPLSKNFKEKI